MPCLGGHKGNIMSQLGGKLKYWIGKSWRHVWEENLFHLHIWEKKKEEKKIERIERLERLEKHLAHLGHELQGIELIEEKNK